MSFLKKASILLSLAILTSCSNINSGKTTLKDIRDILGETESSKETIAEIEKDEFEQEEVVLTGETVSKYLDIVKDRLKKSEKRINDLETDNYKVFVGEYLITPASNMNSVRVTSSPKNTNSRARLENGNLIFRTIYRGNYGLSIYQGANLIKRLNISAVTKYNFSESNIYDIITENSQTKTKILEDAISLYKIYYPNGSNIRRVNYLLLDYAYEIKNKSMINEALEALKSDIISFPDEEKIKIIQAAKSINKEIFIPDSVYRTANSELQKELSTFIKNKRTLDRKDVVFLEKIAANQESAEKTQTLERVNAWYQNNGDVTKSKEILNQTAETKIENFYDKAIKNMNTNPRLAIENFKKSLSTERNKNRRAETYYNIANSYLKLGNKVEAQKYLTLIKQEFAGSDWVKRSEILINTIK